MQQRKADLFWVFSEGLNDRCFNQSVPREDYLRLGRRLGQVVCYLPQFYGTISSGLQVSRIEVKVVYCCLGLVGIIPFLASGID